MDRIQNLFKNKQTGILSVYFTAGFPALNDTQRIIRYLDEEGIDLLEIGIPFSDPIADGPVIQESSHTALLNGMTLNLLFEQLENIREKTGIPLLLMGYLNPIYKMGMERFLEKCNACGIDGVIIPDFPLEEYRDNYQILFKQYRIKNMLLITPQTPDERVREIDSLSEGFIYMVSSYATTGTRDEFSSKQVAYFKRIKDMELKNPRLVGFGVSTANTFKAACEYASGAIVGSAFIRALDQDGPIREKIGKFVKIFRG